MMRTYVFTRTRVSGWSLRTSYPDHYEAVLKRYMSIISDEYHGTAEGDEEVSVGMLLVYFPSGESGVDPATSVQVHEYQIRRHLPVAVERWSGV